MGKRGPKPKIMLPDMAKNDPPAAVKGKKTEPATAKKQELPPMAPPAELGQEGKAEWLRLTEHLNLQATDYYLLMSVCDAVEKLKLAMRKFTEDGGQIVKKSEDGGTYYNMILAEIHKQRLFLVKTAPLLGLSLKHRADLAKNAPNAFRVNDKKKNPFADE